MTKLTPNPAWSDVPEIETDTALLGGPGGPLNAQAQALLNRMEYLGSADGAAKVGFQQVGEGASARTLQDEARTQVTATQFGAVADGATDSTLSVIAAAASVGSNGLVVIPYGVKYNRPQVDSDASVPVGVLFRDDSMINGGYAGDNIVGYFDKGDPSSATDNKFMMSSGHNAAMLLDNTGRSGSNSSNNRYGGLFWTAGQQQKGAGPKLRRSMAGLQFGIISSDVNRWGLSLRKYAPAPAIAPTLPNKGYWTWDVGVPVVTGEYCFHDENFYIAENDGTTGSTAPTHTTGAVSDGGVTWEHVSFSYDGTVLQVNDLGQISTNTAIGTGQFARFRQHPDDTNACAFVIEASSASRPVVISPKPTDASAATIPAPALKWDANGLTVTGSSGPFAICTFNDSGVLFRGITRFTPTAIDGDTTPSVLHVSALLLSNSAATTVTTLDDGVANQEVRLIFSNGNTTLKNGTGFTLAGGVDITPTTSSVITFQKVSYSSAWVEVSRSIK